MSIEVKVPQLPESVADATLVAWHKKAGDAVRRDENLVDLETDKVVLEVPAPSDGVLKEIKIDDGATVTSGQVLALLEAGDAPAKGGRTEAKAGEQKEEQASGNAAAPKEAKKEGKKEEKKESKSEKAESKPKSKSEKSDSTAEAAGTEQRGEAAKFGPAVRKLLEEHDLDPGEIDGSGRDGRVTKGDVLAYLEKTRKEGEESDVEPQAAPAAKPSGPSGERGEHRVAMTRLRSRIAERLVEAQRTAAMLTTFNEVDMSEVMALRSRYQDRFVKRYEIKLGFMSFFVKAVIEALRKFPVLNASVDGKDIVYHEYFDIGVAVSTDRGLLVPIIRDADSLGFADIEQAITDFGKRARSGDIDMNELTGGTFTITNGGIFGSMMSTPILNPPQSGILGMHKIQQRAVAIDGEVQVRPMMYIALTYDHRVVDGREAVQFLVSIKEQLEDPARLILQI